jgi:hypothetical protein
LIHIQIRNAYGKHKLGRGSGGSCDSKLLRSFLNKIIVPVKVIFIEGVDDGSGENSDE